MSNTRLKVAISHGDINGIGYEILLKVFADERILELFTPIVYGSEVALVYWRNVLGLDQGEWVRVASPSEARDGVVNLIEVAEGEVRVEPGKATEHAGRLAFLALQRATDDVLEGKADLLVTAPINKSIMPREEFPFAGHTEYLQRRAAVEQGKSLMLMTSSDCRIALATGHIPISEVSSSLTRELIIQKVQTLEAGLIRDFGIIKPRIAVLALNPHAGDRGLIGDEEDTVIKPAIKALADAGHVVFGPYAADGFWAAGHTVRFDGILAMYHDQGLAPFKSLYMVDGVNITLGLKIIRTSPDHGTGYDIVGQGIASPDSFRHAIYLGLDAVRHRQGHDMATRNPLRRTYFNKGRDEDTPEALDKQTD